jgi:hypothetical protein
MYTNTIEQNLVSMSPDRPFYSKLKLFMTNFFLVKKLKCSKKCYISHARKREIFSPSSLGD